MNACSVVVVPFEGQDFTETRGHQLARNRYICTVDSIDSLQGQPSIRMFYMCSCSIVSKFILDFRKHIYNIRSAVRLLLEHLVPLPRLQWAHCWGKRWHSVLFQHTSQHLLVFLKECREALFALVLQRHQLLGTSISDLQHVLLRARLAAHRQQRDDVALGDHTRLCILPSHITLPIWVLCEVRGGDSDGVVVELGVAGTGRWVTELRVEGNTGRALGVDSKEVVDTSPDTGRLDGVFLRRISGLTVAGVRRMQDGYTPCRSPCGQSCPRQRCSGEQFQRP